MATDDNDVDKLLNQMRIQDFRYRAFESGERPSLRVVKPVASAPPAPPPAPAAPPPRETVATRNELPANRPPPPAAPRTTLGVSEAFDRISRRAMADSAPRLHLHLDLPLRPPLQAGPLAQAATSNRLLADVFKRLDAAEVSPGSSAASTGR